MFFLDNDGRCFAPTLLPHAPPPKPPQPAPPPAPTQVAPLKNDIYKSLQNGKSLKTAMQAARQAHPKLDQQALTQAALLAQEEWQAAQAAAKAASQKSVPKTAPKTPPKAPPDPFIQASASVANTGLIAPAALARATAALQHPSAPTAPGKPPPSPPTSAQVQVYIGQIGQHQQEGMTLAQAVNAARIDQGGGAGDEQALAEAALAVQGSTHLAGIAQGQDPITAAQQDLVALKAFQPATLKAAGAAMVAPKAGPDRGVAPAVAAQQKLQADSAAHASAATLAADRAALHQALGNQLVGLYGGHDAFLTDATQVDKLWQGEYETMRDDVVALFRAQDHGDSAAGPSAQSVDDQAQSLFTSIQAAVIMRQVSDAQGGPKGTDYVRAAQTLSADLQGAGATPGSALANQIIGSDPSHPADAAVAALTHNAIAQVAGRAAPLACTATDDGDPTHKLAALSNALMPYEGTVIDAPLIDGVTHNANTQILFNMLAPASLMQQADAHTKLAQVAGVLDAAKTSPALANALYEEKFRGSGVDSAQGGVLYWAAHATSDAHQTAYYTNLGRIYNDLGGAGSADAVALRGVVAARMGQPGNAVATGMTVTPHARGDYLSGRGSTAPTPQFGLGDVRSAGANLQLYQDILDTQPNSQTAKEIAKETQYQAGGAQAWANTVQARSGAGLDTLAPAGGLQAATSHAQLVDALGQAFNLTPRVPHSNADWQAQQQGSFVAYDEQQKVHGNTTLGQLADAAQRGADIAHISDTTPVIFSALPLNYWTHDQDPQKDAPQQLSLIDLQNAGGQQSYVGPADTTVRASYTDWQSHSGFDKGQMMVLPNLLSGAGGQPLTGNGYWLQHQTGSDHWYDWDHLKTDLEVAGTVAAAALATFVAPEGAPLWLALLADAADAYLTYQAVSGTAQAVQAMYTQGPDGSYGYQHWQTYLQLGANAFGGLAGAGGLGARSAALLGRAGTAGRVATVAARGAKISDGVASALVHKSILLPAVGLNLAANGTTGWQIADAMIHGQDVSASQKLQFALSAALTALPFAVRGRIGTSPAPASRASRASTAAPKAPVSAAASASATATVPVATLTLADGSSVELDAPAHDYAGTGPQFKLEPHGSKLSHAAHRVGSALILPAGLLFHTVASATGWQNGVLDLLSERSWPSLGGKMRSVVSKAMSITLKTGLQRALDAAQRGDTAEVERQMNRLLAHRTRLGLPEFAGHVLPILADSLQDAALAQRALARTAGATPGDPATARFAAQAQARYEQALASFKENRAKVGKTAFATTAYGRAMRRASMLLAAIGAGDALADPTLLPAQKVLYLASGLVSTGTQWFYMHAMLDYARNPNDATLAKLAKASQWNDRVYAANFLIDASLGGINEARGALLSGLFSFSQAAGEGTFYLATRHLPSRKQIIAAGAGLFLMVGSAAASHLKAGGGKSTPAGAAQPPLPAADAAPWQLAQAMANLAEAPFGLTSMAHASPWRLPYVEVSARSAATRTLWGIAQSHSSALQRSAEQTGGPAVAPDPDTDAGPLTQLAGLNPQFDWSLDAPGLIPARTPRGQNPNLIFPGQLVWVS